MKRKYILTSLALSCLFVTGCQDLDTMPQGSTVTTDQKEEITMLDPAKASAGVNAIYAQMITFMPNERALGAARHNDFGYPSVMLFTDQNGWDIVSYDNGYNWVGNSLTFNDRPYTSRESQIVWNDMYSYVYAANNVANIMSVNTEIPLQQLYLAQSLATRAWAYFILAQLYQFNYVGNENKPCVPVITEKNMAEAPNGTPRSTVQEVYNQIFEDINNAIMLLDKAEIAGVTRADKRYINAAVAYGIRARVNLTIQKYKDAAADAKEAIAKSGAQPASIQAVSVPAFWTTSETNWMWGLIIAETDRVVTSGIVNWPSHMGSLNYGYANFAKGRLINKKLYNSIPETDVRKGWWLNDKVESKNLNNDQKDFVKAKSYGPYVQVKFAPYNNVVANSTNANDIPLMRVEEMYFIQAEAELMSGGNGKSTLETFMKTYRDPEYTCTASSVADIQEEIFRQKSIELWGEGLNWYDIMRLNKGVDRRGGGFPDANTIFNIPAKDPILLWRIPEAEIQANAALRDEDNNPATPIPTPVSDDF